MKITRTLRVVSSLLETNQPIHQLSKVESASFSISDLIFTKLDPSDDSVPLRFDLYIRLLDLQKDFRNSTCI